LFLSRRGLCLNRLSAFSDQLAAEIILSREVGPMAG
jgi:hypothetical protein